MIALDAVEMLCYCFSCRRGSSYFVVGLLLCVWTHDQLIATLEEVATVGQPTT